MRPVILPIRSNEVLTISDEVAIIIGDDDDGDDPGGRWARRLSKRQTAMEVALFLFAWCSLKCNWILTL